MRGWLVLVAVVAGCGRFGFDSGFGVDPSSVDLPMLPCGGTSSTTFTLHGGTTPVTFTAIADVPGTTIAPDHGTVQAGQDLTLTFTATADPVAIPGTALTGDLLIETDDPTIGEISLPISIVMAGGVITTDLTTLDFGQVTNATTRVRSLMVENTGNGAVSVVLGSFADPGFVISGTSTFDLAAGASRSVDVEFDPTATQIYSSMLPLAVQGATCDAVPVVDVRGAGTNSTVLLDHTALDFGPVSCGTSAGAMTVNVTNGNSTQYPFTASVTSGAASFTVIPVTGSLPGSGSVSLEVDHAAVPVPSATGLVTGNLHVVITGAPNGTTDLPLDYNVSGSYLGASTTAIDFGRVMTSAQQTVTITNTGNQIADVQLTKTGSNRFSAPTSFQIPAASSKPLTITFNSDDGNTTWTADFAVSAANVCSSPLTIHVQGTGKGGGQ